MAGLVAEVKQAIKKVVKLVDQLQKLKLCSTLILPHFDYCSTVWSPPCDSINSQN